MRSRLTTCAVLLGIAVVSCAPGSKPTYKHAEIPLHWALSEIDSVGGIPADEFAFMPSDRVRPTSPAGRDPGGEFTATVDSAITAKLLFRRTALHLATRYSREQQREIQVALRVALGRRALLDSLWADREETIRQLEGRLPLRARSGASPAIRVVSASEAEVLRALPLLTWFELEDIASGNPVHDIAPRQFQLDLWSLNWAPRDILCLPAAMVGEVSADTTLPLSTRLEFFRIGAMSSLVLESGDSSVPWPDSLVAPVVARLTPLLERIRAERRLPSRYRWLDDSAGAGNRLR